MRRPAALFAALLVLVLVAVLLSLATGDDNGDSPRPGRFGPQPERFVVGSGTRAAVVLGLRERKPGRPVVVFLHGWTAADPDGYSGWIRHLVASGADVVFPIYQAAPFADVRSPLPDALASLRSAFARLPGHGPVVAVGHSAGGTLAAGYAASADDAGLPVPDAVYAVYPGRDLGAIGRLAIPPLAQIPATTRMLVLASPRDAVVGTVTARALVAEATQVPRARRELRIITETGVDDHNAPHHSGGRERATFWAPLDRLVTDARSDR